MFVQGSILGYVASVMYVCCVFIYHEDLVLDVCVSSYPNMMKKVLLGIILEV